MSQPPAGFGPEFVVPFDLYALERHRGKLRRTAWLDAAVVSLFVLPIVALCVLSVVYSKLAILTLFLLAVILAGTVPRCRRLNRIRRWSLWTPDVAMRLTADGLRIGTDGVTTVASYPWHLVQALRCRTVHGELRLVVELLPGVTPDLALTIGVEEVDPVPRFWRAFGRRGPRFVADTLAVPLPVLDTAVRHYSAGRVGVWPS